MPTPCTRQTKLPQTRLQRPCSTQILTWGLTIRPSCHTSACTRSIRSRRLCIATPTHHRRLIISMGDIITTLILLTWIIIIIMVRTCTAIHLEFKS
mmetsp:Transcript_56011/g.132112  ORF Transcript_56011/g.132112 Transcript_56011/m.132112 type:complete len:96 (+) Transcript_56011:882-1169(+)